MLALLKEQSARFTGLPRRKPQSIESRVMLVRGREGEVIQFNYPSEISKHKIIKPRLSLRGAKQRFSPRNDRTHGSDSALKLQFFFVEFLCTLVNESLNVNELQYDKGKAIAKYLFASTTE